MILHLASKELKAMFASPMGWVVLALVQLVIGSYYTVSFNQYFEIIALKGTLPDQMGMTEFMCEGVFGTASLLFLFVIPLVSMRVISDEYKDKTMPFLISAPISLTQLILGKFVALMIYHSLIILNLCVMVCVLGIWVTLDYGLIISNTVGLWLLMCSAVAVSLFFSAQTKYAIVAGFLSFLTLAALTMFERFATQSQSLLNQFALMSHFHSFEQGVINTHDIAYFGILSLCFVLLTVHHFHLSRIKG